MTQTVDPHHGRRDVSSASNHVPLAQHVSRGGGGGGRLQAGEETGVGSPGMFPFAVLSRGVSGGHANSLLHGRTPSQQPARSHAIHRRR